MTERPQHRISRSPGPDLAQHLRDLAARVARLGPDRRDPERSWPPSCTAWQRIAPSTRDSDWAPSVLS
jgi:hypothetical protein